MKIILLFLIALLLSSCSASKKEVSSVSPCNDSLYKSLKQKPLETLTEREYTFFINKEKECSDYKKAVLETQTEDEGGGNMATGLIVTGLGVIIVIVIVNVMNKK